MKDIVLAILKFIINTFLVGLGKCVGCQGDCSCKDS